MRRCFLLFCVWVSLWALAPALMADGGGVLTREKTGPFLVTVFEDPAEPWTGILDLSVMVQSSTGNEAILDAEVELFLVPPRGVRLQKPAACCAGPDGVAIAECAVGADDQPRAIPATRKQATNKLLYAAQVNVPAAGEWQLQVRVRQGAKRAELNYPLIIAAGQRSMAAVGPFVAAPVVMIGLFAWHQRLRRKSQLTLARG